MPQPLNVYSTTHEGLVHDKNEDSHAVLGTEEDGTLLLICDGMGGMGRGDVASALAVEEIARRIVDGTGFPPERLRRAIREADTAVRAELCSDGRGMPGATAVMVYVLDGMGHVAWAGDSRAYLVRDGRTLERTKDHKLVNELVAAGQLSQAEAQHSALAHVVTRALGGRPPSDRPVKPSTLGHPWKLAHGDTIVLCSDGVCDLLGDEEIAAAVQGVEPEEGASRLQALALERGGHDNITAIVAIWEGDDYVEDEIATPSFGPPRAEYPDRDLRDPVPIPDEDSRGSVTEEIDPNWRPGQDVHEEEPSLEVMEVASSPVEATIETDPPPQQPVESTYPKAPASEGPSPMILLAIALGVAVLVGLVVAIL